MKTVLRMLVVIFMLSVVLPSCEKQEISVPMDVETIASYKSQLSGVETITIQKFNEYVSSQPVLKSGNVDENPVQPVLVQIFDLDEETYEVYEETAAKYLIYYELDPNGSRLKLLTIRQEFDIKNGKVDTSYYRLTYQVGCPFSRYFLLRNTNDINSINFYFRFDNGKQFAYFGNGGSTIKLPPIKGGKWQLQVSYNDGDMQQQFMSKMIDFYNENIIVELNLGIKLSNVVSTMRIDRKFIKEAFMIQLIGEDKNGDTLYMNYLVSDNGSLPQMTSYDTYFDIKEVLICSNGDGCRIYSADDMDVMIDLAGKKTYLLK